MQRIYDHRNFVQGKGFLVSLLSLSPQARVKFSLLASRFGKRKYLMSPSIEAKKHD